MLKGLWLDSESWTEDDRSRFYAEGEPIPDLTELKEVQDDDETRF